MDKKFDSLGVAYFLGALGAWIKQLDRMGLSPSTTAYLKIGIDEALNELRGGKVNG